MQCSLAVVGGVQVAREKDMENPMRKKLELYETKLECVSYLPPKDALQDVSLALPGTSVAKLRVLPHGRHYSFSGLAMELFPQETTSLDGPSQTITVAVLYE